MGMTSTTHLDASLRGFFRKPQRARWINISILMSISPIAKLDSWLDQRESRHDMFESKIASDLLNRIQYNDGVSCPHSSGAGPWVAPGPGCEDDQALWSDVIVLIFLLC